MKFRREITLTKDNITNIIVEDSRDILRKSGFSEAETDIYVEQIVGILEDYAECFGEGAEVEYLFSKRLLKAEFRFLIPGKPFDPFIEGNSALKRSYNKMYSLNLNAGRSGISHRYVLGFNIISIAVPLADKEKKIIKDPVIWSILLGFALGMLVRVLPQPVNNFIVEEIASPLQSIVLNMIAGIMGPVIFISLLSSVIALENINELTGLGFRIIRRFLLIILFLITVSILVSGLIFRNFGDSSATFSPALFFRMLFDVIPTNLVEPFLYNNTAQLVLLGLFMGAGLLILGDTANELKRIIEQINKWIMSVMNIVLLTMPAIPFFSLMITLARGREKDLLSGWKFVAASYLAFTICIVIKAVKTSLRTRTGIPGIWQKIKPAAGISFTTSSTTASLRSVYEISDELGIKQSFSSFWIPMGTAMLSPKTAVNVVIAAFMAAEIKSISVSHTFLMILVIMAMELSTASPGIPVACTVVLRSLGLPVDYVGIITTYRLLTDNYGSAVAISYNILEEYEIAYRLGEVEKDGAGTGGDT